MATDLLKGIKELVHVPTGSLLFNGGSDIDLMLLNGLSTPVRILCNGDMLLLLDNRYTGSGDLRIYSIDKKSLLTKIADVSAILGIDNNTKRAVYKTTDKYVNSLNLNNISDIKRINYGSSNINYNAGYLSIGESEYPYKVYIYNSNFTLIREFSGERFGISHFLINDNLYYSGEYSPLKSFDDKEYKLVSSGSCKVIYTRNNTIITMNYYNSSYSICRYDKVGESINLTWKKDIPTNSLLKEYSTGNKSAVNLLSYNKNNYLLDINTGATIIEYKYEVYNISLNENEEDGIITFNSGSVYADLSMIRCKIPKSSAGKFSFLPE